MKKFFIFLFSFFLLVGCKSVGTSSTSEVEVSPSISESVSISIPEESVSNSEPVSEKVSTSITDDDRPVLFEWTYESDSWSTKLLQVIAVVTGDDRVDLVPEVRAQKYEFSAHMLKVESALINTASIQCYGVNEKTVEADFERVLKLFGFQLSYDDPYAFMEFTVTEDLIVEYSLKEDAKKGVYFDLLVYKVEFRLAEWPEKTIQGYMGRTIPKLDAKSYEISQDVTLDNKIRLNIYAFHIEMTRMEYEIRLVQAGFTINYNSTLVEAVSSDGLLHVSYSFYDDEDSASIYVYNDWPYADLMSTLEMNLPMLNETYSKFSFSFVYVNDYEVLTIYFDGTNETSLMTYDAQLKEIGFVQDGEQYEHVSGTGAETVTTKTRQYVINDGTVDEHFIQVIYCVEQKSLAIAVYY